MAPTSSPTRVPATSTPTTTTCPHGTVNTNGVCVDINECAQPSPTCKDNDKALALILSQTLPYISTCSDILSYRATWNSSSIAEACAIVGTVLNDAHANQHPISSLCECECAATPCKNGASCAESGSDASVPKGRFLCSCKTGWGGFECDQRTRCSEGPCLHGTCTDSLDSNGTLHADAFLCSCEPGWTGKTCAIGSCHSSPCLGS